MYLFRWLSNRSADEYYGKGRESGDALMKHFYTHGEWVDNTQLDRHLTSKEANSKQFKDILYEFKKHGGSYSLEKLS